MILNNRTCEVIEKANANYDLAQKKSGLKSLNPVSINEKFSTKEELLSSEKIAIEKFEAIELKAILKIVNKTLGKLVSTDLNIRVEAGSLIFNVVNQVEIKLNRQVDNKFSGLSFNINALMFEKNATLVKSEIVAFDMVNRIILADKNIISAYYDNSNNTMIEYEKEKYERNHQLRKITDKERTQLGKQGIYITTETIYKAFDNKELYDTSYNRTMNTTNFEISTDNKEVLEALKELGVKKVRKVKEIKTNDLYIVESLETPEVIEVKKEIASVETNNNLIPLETIANWIKRDNDYKHQQEQISKERQALKPSIPSNLYDDDFKEINPREIRKKEIADRKKISNVTWELNEIEYIIETNANMSKSDIFKLAHRLAKTFEGDYKACLSMALKEVYSKIKSLKEKSLSLAA